MTFCLINAVLTHSMLVYKEPLSLSPGVNLLGRGADHTPSPNAEVKNSWSYISTPPTRLNWCDA